MWKIAKRFKVQAAHHLIGLPPTHKCAQPHGHGYTIEFVLEGHRLAPEGWLMDYGELSVLAKGAIAEMLGVQVDNWDHGDWNNAVKQPTAENLARELYLRMVALLATNDYCRLYKVKVSEEPGQTWAEWRP
jgi:6-pyruvoyltetrahydropterin/6-carboxytetrahydropterin synthase